MTLNFNNVYVNNTATVAGHLEKEGPLGKFFDKSYVDYYMDKKSLEKSEVVLQKDSIDLILKKCGLKKEDVDVLIAGDLQNQITASSYAVCEYNIPFLGVFSACATSMESVILASSLIDSNKVNNAICVTSSHNLAAEKQFRNPTDYGAPKPKTATFTSTGAASIFLSNNKSDIKVTSGTIGKVIDMNQTDPNHMGAVMAPAAADTIYRHLKNLNETPDDYDLILTGDLGLFGAKILKEYIKKEYNIKLKGNYNDCGIMLYDMKKQKEITAGGSGPVCSALVNYGYIYQLLKIKKLKKVLLVTTGALFSPTYAYQKNNLLAIAHAISLEVVS